MYLGLCNACGSYLNKLFFIKEMMQGTKEAFEYGLCNTCGSLQLLKIPGDIAKYYTQNYYSNQTDLEQYFKPKWKAVLKGWRDAYCLTGKGVAGAMIQKKMPNKSLEIFNFQDLSVKKSWAIADIGCGTGKWPYIFFNAGFKNIKGYEPYLNQTIHYNNGLKIIKGDLENLKEHSQDLIMFNHSFEHIPDPKNALMKVFQKLKANGYCYIRIPTVSSFAWKQYKEHWVQLDAPRHVTLFSRKGISILAESCGFELMSIKDEGTAFQFIGSEQYKKGIPMYGDQRSYFEGNGNLFSSEQIANWNEQATDLNKKGDSDSIAVVLKKIKPDF